MTASQRPVALYARLSVTTEESVSIERQVESARKYAEARGWQIVAEATDDGVSATKHKPEARPGWRSLLDSPEPFEAVIVWKVDRLARRVLDFLHADEALNARGAGIVAVEDPIDMTTAQGKAFATMLAVFGEMEAAAISARVRAARQAVLRAGRFAGGRAPFGWRSVKNPDGPGVVLAQDPDRIGIVEALVEGALGGASMNALSRWLMDQGVEPHHREGRLDAAFWHPSTVETILRNPVLAGLTTYNPGRKEGEKIDRSEVLRDADGLPVVDESVAILSTSERRALLKALDDGKRPGARQATAAEPALLYGLIRCSSCGGLMHRATGGGGRYTYYRCSDPRRGCERPMAVSRPSVEGHVCEAFLERLGHARVVEVEEVGEEDSAALVDVQGAIDDTLAALGEDDADVVALAERLASLKAARTRARAEAEAAERTVVHHRRETWAEAWDAAEGDVEARRLLLLGSLDAVWILPGGGRGRTFDGARVDIDWRDETYLFEADPDWADDVA